MRTFSHFQGSLPALYIVFAPVRTTHFISVLEHSRHLVSSAILHTRLLPIVFHCGRTVRTRLTSNVIAQMHLRCMHSGLSIPCAICRIARWVGTRACRSVHKQEHHSRTRLRRYSLWSRTGAQAPAWAYNNRASSMPLAPLGPGGGVDR